MNANRANLKNTVIQVNLSPSTREFYLSFYRLLEHLHMLL